MAERKFTLNTEPHIARIGDNIVLKFKPEVQGAEFLDAYEEIRHTMGRFEDARANDEDIDLAELRDTLQKTRDFVATFLTAESAEEFPRLDLPDRVLGDLLEWVMELYSAERPTGRSGGSAKPRPRAGAKSTANSRSKASTRKTGRSAGSSTRSKR